MVDRQISYYPLAGLAVIFSSAHGKTSPIVATCDTILMKVLMLDDHYYCIMV